MFTHIIIHASGLTPWYQRPQCAISFMREDTCVVHYVHTSGLTLVPKTSVRYIT